MEVIKENIMEELSRHYLAVDEKQLNEFIRLLERAKRVFFFAQGREMLMLSAFAMRVHHMGFHVYVVGETSVPAIGEDDVLVVSSGMGYGLVLSVQLKTAKNAGALIIGLTAHPENEIGNQSDHIVKLFGQTLADPVENLTSIQPTGSSYEQSLLLTLDYVVIKMMQKNSWKEKDLSQRHTNLE
jgi:6-phospho-3-hexuloisomerase